MTRTFAAAALLALPAAAPAQTGTLRPVGPPVLGGRAVPGPPITNGPSALFQTPTPVPPRFGVGGGSLGEPTQIWLPSGAWGGVSYAWPVQPVVAEPAPGSGPKPARTPVVNAPVRVAVADPQTAMSGREEAKLVIQFPAAAEVWVGGRKADGNAKSEWTLISPLLAAGESHTFEVKGRWKVDGKPFEAERKVTVLAGERSRALVFSGTAVKE